MSDSLLTKHCLQQMMVGNTNMIPTVQILNVSKVVTANRGEDKYRVLISDGTNCIFGILSTQMASKVTNGEIRNNAIVQLDKFHCNAISCRKVCVVIKCSVKAHANGVIGMPRDPETGKLWNSKSSNNQNQAQSNNNNNNQVSRFFGNLFVFAVFAYFFLIFFSDILEKKIYKLIYVYL